MMSLEKRIKEEVRRKLLLVLLLSPLSCLLSPVFAQWTIQAVAFRDYRDAQVAVEQLQTLGFEAYSEFSSGSDGLQYARVRVGCFDSQETAELTVQRLAGSYTKEAVAVPLSPNAPVPYCVRREIGFVTPTTWYTYFTAVEHAVFMAEVQGQQAFLKHDGARWAMGQTLGELGITEVAASVMNAGYFGEVAASPAPHILYRSDITILVSQGKLLWQRGNVVLVQENDMVVAYHVEKR
ncbi:MAG: SPOR domain-containing protein [Trueperaceae bacterium]